MWVWGGSKLTPIHTQSTWKTIMTFYPVSILSENKHQQIRLWGKRMGPLDLSWANWLSYVQLRLGGRIDRYPPKKTFRDDAKKHVGIVPYNALGTGDPVKIQEREMGCPILEEEHHLTQTLLTDFRLHSSCFKSSGGYNYFSASCTTF